MPSTEEDMGGLTATRSRGDQVNASLSEKTEAKQATFQKLRTEKLDTGAVKRKTAVVWHGCQRKGGKRKNLSHQKEGKRRTREKKRGDAVSSRFFILNHARFCRKTPKNGNRFVQN